MARLMGPTGPSSKCKTSPEGREGGRGVSRGLSGRTAGAERVVTTLSTVVCLESQTVASVCRYLILISLFFVALSQAQLRVGFFDFPLLDCFLALPYRPVYIYSVISYIIPIPYDKDIKPRGERRFRRIAVTRAQT